MVNWVGALTVFAGNLATAVGAQDAGFSDPLTNLDLGGWHLAEYDFSHPGFDTDWRAEQVSASEQGLELRLNPHSGLNRFVGGSLRRHQTSHYGTYTAQIQPARGAGLVTGFFTYTGPHYGTQHDEIDIEFLGKDTTKMHVAWFVDGKLTNKFIDLGFDAADHMRSYSFKWCEERMEWRAENHLLYVHRATDGPIPKTPQRLFLNLWAADPSISNWAGLRDPNITAKARFGQVSFSPLLAAGTGS